MTHLTRSYTNLGGAMALLLLAVACAAPPDTANQPTPLPTVEPAQWQAGAVQQVSTIATDTYTTTAGRVTSIAISPDGRTVAVGRDDASLTLWDAATGELLRTLPKHSGWVTGLAFSPDGVLLASESDGVVSVWQTNDGSLRNAFRADGALPRANLAFSADGQFLFAHTQNTWHTGTGRLWSVATQAVVTTVHTEGGSGWSWNIALHPDGSSFVLNDYLGRFHRYDIASGTRQYTRQGSIAPETPPPWREFGVATFSSDGQTLATVTNAGTIRLWHAADGTLQHTLTSEESDIVTAAFSPDRAVLAVGTRWGTITLWRVADGELLQTLGRQDGAIRALQFSADGRVLLSGSDSGEIIRWHPADPAMLAALPTAAPTGAPTPTPDPVLAAEPPTPRVLDPVEPLPADAVLVQVNDTIVAIDDGIQHRLHLPGLDQTARISPDGRWVAFYQPDALLVINLHTGRRVRLNDRVVFTHRDEVFTFSPDSRTLAYVVQDAHRWHIRALDLEQMTTRVLLEGDTQEMPDLRLRAWMTQGLVATVMHGDAQHLVRIDLTDGSRQRLLDRTWDGVYPSPDEQRLLLVNSTGPARYPTASLRLYDLDMQQMETIIRGTTPLWIADATWSPDSQRIACRLGGTGPDTARILVRMPKGVLTELALDTNVIGIAWQDTEVLLALVEDADNRIVLYELPVAAFSPVHLNPEREVGMLSSLLTTPVRHVTEIAAKEQATVHIHDSEWNAHILRVPR